MHWGEETQLKLKLRKFRRWPLRCPLRWPLSEVSPLKYRGVAKSEDAPTREVTAAAKCGEVAETCKNYLFYVKIRIQNAKGREVLVAVHCTIYQFIMCGGGGEGASLCGANKHIICVFMTLNLNLQSWKSILKLNWTLCDKSEKCPSPWSSVSRDSLLANFKRIVSRQLKSCNPFLPSFLAAAAGILRKLLKTHLAVCPHTCTEMPPNANTVYFEHPFKPKCTQTEIATINSGAASCQSTCWPPDLARLFMVGSASLRKQGSLLNPSIGSKSGSASSFFNNLHYICPWGTGGGLIQEYVCIVVSF